MSLSPNPVEAKFLIIMNLTSFPYSRTPTKPGVPGSMPTDSIPFYLPDHIGGFRLAHSTFSAVESRFGLVFPKSAPNQ